MTTDLGYGKVYKPRRRKLFMSQNIPAALREMTRIVGKLKELAEWAELARQESRPGVPPSFQPGNHLAEEIRANYGMFIAISLEIKEVLNKPALDVVPGQLAKWRRRLRELDREVNQLELTERFISL